MRIELPLEIANNRPIIRLPQMGVSGHLYELPSFALSEWFFFPAFPIVATYDEQMGDVSMILPFTLFRDVETTISPSTNKVIFDIPDNQPSRRLKIENKDGKLGIYTIA